MKSMRRREKKGDVIVYQVPWVLLIVAAVAIVGYLMYTGSLKGPGGGATANPPKVADNTMPAWSPDGTRIAFVSNRDGNLELYLVNVDTLEATRVTTNAAIDQEPSWTPGGGMIAFCSNRDAQKGLDIYEMHPVSKHLTRLSFTKLGWDCDPSWTPTTAGTPSKYIVFASNRDGNNEIYKMDIDTLAVTRLTFREKTSDKGPTISPDGTKIAFQSFIEGNWEIFVMDSDGRNIKRLTFNPKDDIEPAWSPTGDKIAFTTFRDGNAEIYTMDPDGSNKKNLTNNDADDEYPTWSPDAAMIAFQSNRTGHWQIWRMNSADGTAQKQLTGLE